MKSTTPPAEILKRLADKRLEMLQALSSLTVDLLAPLTPEGPTGGRDETERMKAALLAMSAKAAEFKQLGETFEADMERIASLTGCKPRRFDGEIELVKPDEMGTID